MRYAKDRHGQMIDARYAVGGHRYWCPTCGAVSHRRAGHRRAPYFAHNSGQASEDCELYHPGGYLSSETPNRRTEYRLTPRLLSLYLVCSAVSDPHRSWQLFLFIPEVEAGTGTIEVPHGYSGARTLPVGTLMRGGRRLRVRPQYAPYQVSLQGQADAAYVDRVQRPVAGLNRKGYTVFRYSASGGRRLQDHQPLYWGREYVLVWPAGAQPDWWPRSLVWRPMRPDGSWHCCIIHLPAQQDAQTEAWVSRTLGRAVVEPPAILTLASPVPTSWLDDESLVVPAGSEVMVGLFGEPGTSVPSHIEVRYSGQGVAQEVELPRRLPVLVSLGRLALGRTEVWLPDQPDVGLSLVAVPPDTEPLVLPSVILRFEAPRTSHLLEAPLFSDQLSDWLKDATRSRLRLVGVSLPEQVVGTLRFRTPRETVWHEIALARTREGEGADAWEPHDRFEQRVADGIRGRLARTDCVLQLDFGNFGSVTVDLTAGQSEVETAALRPEQRDQIRWLLSLPDNGGPVASGEGVRLLTRTLGPAIARFDTRDKDMLGALQRRPAWPAAAEPHLRRLAQAVGRN